MIPCNYIKSGFLVQSHLRGFWHKNINFKIVKYVQSVIMKIGFSIKE